MYQQFYSSVGFQAESGLSKEIMRKRSLTQLTVLGFILFTLAHCSILITQLRRKKREKPLENSETYWFSRRTSKWRYLFPSLLRLGLLQYFHPPRSWELHFQERGAAVVLALSCHGPAVGLGLHPLGLQSSTVLLLSVCPHGNSSGAPRIRFPRCPWALP